MVQSFVGFIVGSALGVIVLFVGICVGSVGAYVGLLGNVVGNEDG